MLGESGMVCQTKMAMRMLGKPSRRKRRRHEAMGLLFPNLTIAHARVLANDVARGAADMKNPTLKAISSFLKKKDR